jgi:nicotinate dehydrogenase subunit B
MKREEKITRRLSKDMNNPWGMDRRDFMRRIGGGLIIAFSAGDLALLSGCSTKPEEEKEYGVNAYLRIGEDGRVTLYTGKIEMGQGPITSLPMMLADELDVSLDSIDIIMGDTDLCPWDEGTAGSTSTRVFGQIMRAAAAEARARLLEMAAEKLSVPAAQLSVSDGIVTDRSDETRQVSYAELTQGKEILETVKEKPALKKASEFRVMGKPMLHTDGALKVTGTAKYSGDVKLPGMVYARILRPPSRGAIRLSADTSGAEAIEGVEIVKKGQLLAVLHESQDVADLAITKIKAKYKEENFAVDDKSIFEFLVQKGSEMEETDSGGSLTEGEKQAEKTFDSEFRDPYIAHAPMENHTATAVFEGDKLKIWASCQNPFPMKTDVSEALGIPEENVQLMQIFTGGAFGGKLYNPQIIEAARLAKLSGKPVQLIYKREEEFMYDYLRPAAVIKLRSGITAEGKISFWDYNLYFGGGRGSRHFYDIENHRTREFNASRTQVISKPRGEIVHPFDTGAWRAPSNNTNTFARESQMEIMAAAAGKDALEFRLEHLKNFPEMAEVLKAGAEKFGWTPARGPSGRGYGIACGIDVGTRVAVFVEVKVDGETGHVQVKRAVASQNMGMVVNPQGAIIQVEGCIIMGLGYALSEEVRFEGRKMLTRNFDTYGFTRFSWTPHIDVVLIDAQEDPPHGGGEPAIICMGGAVANAVFDATGARLYQLPLTPERVLEAIKSSKS